MFFNKYPHRSNYSFADGFDQAASAVTIGARQFHLEISGYEGTLTHLRLSNDTIWKPDQCLEALTLPEPNPVSGTEVSGEAEILVLGQDADVLLRGRFGVSGASSMFVFDVPANASFYGMGEKNFARLELSGVAARFWNTDVWSDFHVAHYSNHPADPSYLSIPYVIVRVGEEFLGLLLHNPYPAFMQTSAKDGTGSEAPRQLILGNDGGEPNLWILRGPTLRELTRKLQRLVGITPRPPLWSLGYQQSRWGYEGHADLLDLDRRFNEHQIPCDGLWLDLDYMDGFRIFQTSADKFPFGVRATADKLAESGRRIVPILDPGVKFEPGYSVYDDGHAKGCFCKNIEGKEFVGLVWPGETVFPDFTTPAVRSWWADYVKGFADSGFGATWVDMNDPSTGAVDPEGMLFDDGREPHAAYHNQYALGMQMATREGFLKSRPNERPFLLSRSGFIGTSKHAAVWTGDNLSNYFYLKASIPTSVGLSLSGIPFNGPDIGGFGDDTNERLMVDWVKANFLFPFFRNHCVKTGRAQEPFAFPDPVMGLIRRYIRLRYKLIPYLYNLFLDHEEFGDPILRPLFYEFDGFGEDGADDQFMVGPSLLQAPFVEKGLDVRTVHLPGLEPWYDACSGNWVPAGTTSVKNDRSSTPMFVRSGTILPMQPGTPLDNRKELLKVHLHVFVPGNWSGEATTRYRVDDGISFGYQKGETSVLEVRLAGLDGNLAISYDPTHRGFGDIEPVFVINGDVRSVRLNGSSVRLSPARVVLTGKPLKVVIAQPD